MPIEFQSFVKYARGLMAVIEEQGFVGELFELQFTAAGKRMSPAEVDQELFLEKGLRDEPLQVDRRTQEAHVDLAFKQRFVLACGKNVFATDVDVGESLRMPKQGLLDFLSQTGSEPNSDQTILSGMGSANGVHGKQALIDQDTSLVKQDSSRVGQADFSAIAKKKADAKFRLQLLNLSAERRLGDMQLARRLGEVESLSDSYEVPEVPEFHKTDSNTY